MNQFDITAFTAEIGGSRYQVIAEDSSVLPVGSASVAAAKNLEREYAALQDEMNDDPALRHCDSGYAFAVELKRKHNARIWDIKRAFYPADAIF